MILSATLGLCIIVGAALTARRSPSSHGLYIEKLVVKSRDWNTGGLIAHNVFKIKIDGHEVGIERLKALVNDRYADLLQYPTLLDVTAVDQNSWLLIFSISSNDRSYPVVQLVFAENLLDTKLINIGTAGSAYSWFPLSRLGGWIRVVGDDESQYMIHATSPLKVVNLGKGDVAKIDYPIAFLVDGFTDRQFLIARAVELETGKELAKLKLSREQFGFPQFLFDHPVDLHDLTPEYDKYVHYDEGPQWWDQNFIFVFGENSRIELKENHVLPRPVTKELITPVRPPAATAACVDPGGVTIKGPVASCQ